MADLRFTKTEAGRWHARGERHNYLAQRLGPDWRLEIFEHGSSDLDRELKLSGRKVNTDLHDSYSIAKATAQEFEDLGEDYKQSEHGGRGRYTEAVGRAYDA
jgi:hypothetical protein